MNLNLNLIVCVDNNFNIGCNNKLLFNIKKDMEYFKSKTLNNVIIMGRKTLQSLPNSSPLPNRVNIVMSTNTEFSGCVCVKDLNSLFEELKNYKDKEIYVIGGEQIYNLLLPYCNYAYVTKVLEEKPADSKFPNIDKLDNWDLIETITENENNINFSFNTYVNKSPK